VNPSPPPPNHDIILYTRPGCSYCREARKLLLEHGIAFQEVDIANNTELQAQYRACVPVVVVDGRVRFRGRVSGPLLRKLLRLPHPLPSRQKLL